MLAELVHFAIALLLEQALFVQDAEKVEDAMQVVAIVHAPRSEAPTATMGAEVSVGCAYLPVWTCNGRC